MATYVSPLIAILGILTPEAKDWPTERFELHSRLIFPDLRAKM